MADVPAPPPPPPPPPPGNAMDQQGLLGNSIMTPSQSGSSLQSMASSEASTGSSQSLDSPGKRPATIEEIKQSARKWSLAGDAGVLLYFKQFSQNMLRRTHELEKLVDKLAYDTKGLDSKVHNTFNDFLMLSNKQFIENRVYDEEISQEETTEKEPQQQQNKTREQLESEILPRFSQAVNLGFQVLEDAFITVELKPSEESDDEDEESLPAGYVPDPIIEPKDMYASRSLPHLIGTAEFFSDETLGLIEIDDEEEDDMKQKEQDEDASEAESESEESESDYTESSSEEEVKKPTKKHISDESDSEEDSEESDEDLFGGPKKKIEESESEPESEEDDISQPKPKMDIQAELAAKLGLQSQVPVVKVSEDKSDKSDTQSVSSKRSVGDTQSISNAAETASIASVSKSKKEGKHRSHSKRSGSHRKHKESSSGKHHKKEQEEESDEDLFGESKDKNNFEDEDPFGKKNGMFSGGGTLFDNEPSGDLFGDMVNEDKPTSTVAETPESEPPTPTEIKPRTRTTSSGKKIPAGAVSLFGDTNLFGGGGKEPSIKEEGSKKADSGQTKKPPPVVKGLFNEEEDDDLFNTAPKQDTLKEPPKQKRKKTLELFDDNEDSSLFATGTNEQSSAVAKQKKDTNDKKTAIEPKENDGLFGNVADKKPQEKINQEVKKSSKPKVLSLFDDDDAEEQDWFDNVDPSKNKTTNNQPKDTTKPGNAKQSGSLFDDSISPETEPPPLKKEEPKRKPSKARKVVSLFDEDDDEDLFGYSSPAAVSSKPKEVNKAAKEQETDVKKPEKQAPAKEVVEKVDKQDGGLDVKNKGKKHKAKSFLDNDDSGMFGDDQDDLFTVPNKPPSKTEKTVSKPKPNALSFSDGDYDDLFSSSKPAKTVKGKPNEAKVSTKKQKSTDSNDATSGNEAKGKIKEAPSIRIGHNDDDADLFSDSKDAKDGKPSDGDSMKESDSTPKDQIDAEEPAPKPKKLAGAVSLFGGIDPFAAKNALRSPSKEKVEAPFSEDQKDDELFTTEASKGGHSKPVQQKTPVQTPVPIQSVKETFDASEKSEPVKNETKPEEKVVKERPKIVFNPATLLPGAAPPKRNEEPAAASFEDPPPVQTLTNPNKDRARIQKKRRPPSRQLRQGAADAQEQRTTGQTPETIIENTTTDGISANKPINQNSLDANTNVNTSSVEKPLASKETKRRIKTGDIYDDNSDDLFTTKATPSPESGRTLQAEDKKSAKTEKSVSKNDDLFANEITSEAKNVEKTDKKKTEPKAKGVDFFSGDTNDNDDIFSSITTSNSKIENDVKEDRKSNIIKDVEVSGKVDDLFESTPAKSESKNSTGLNNDDDDDNLFSSSKVSSDENKQKEMKDPSTNNSVKETKSEKNDKDGSEKTKKKKEKTNIFDEGKDDDLFAGKSKKKEEMTDGGKKTKKASKVVTDDDLFGDSGSIFDVPAKTKEKKKKKADSGKDIFASKSDDIFATGTEKKTKAKKKTEKPAKSKATKSQTSEASKSTADIFEDPLNVLGGD